MCDWPLDGCVKVRTSGIEDVLERFAVANVLLNVIEVGLEFLSRCLYGYLEWTAYLRHNISQAIDGFDSFWTCYGDRIWANPDNV